MLRSPQRDTSAREAPFCNPNSRTLHLGDDFNLVRADHPSRVTLRRRGRFRGRAPTALQGQDLVFGTWSKFTPSFTSHSTWQTRVRVGTREHRGRIGVVCSAHMRASLRWQASPRMPSARSTHSCRHCPQKKRHLSMLRRVGVLTFGREKG